jgi:hypothetical protein
LFHAEPHAAKSGQNLAAPRVWAHLTNPLYLTVLSMVLVGVQRVQRYESTATRYQYMARTKSMISAEIELLLMDSTVSERSKIED